MRRVLRGVSQQRLAPGSLRVLSGGVEDSTQKVVLLSRGRGRGGGFLPQAFAVPPGSGRGRGKADGDGLMQRLGTKIQVFMPAVADALPTKPVEKFTAAPARSPRDFSSRRLAAVLPSKQQVPRPAEQSQLAGELHERCSHSRDSQTHSARPAS